MANIKPWQMAVVAAGLLVLAFSLVWTFSSEDETAPAERIVLVDITTGALYRTPRPELDSITYPLTNPDTQQQTLWPAYQNEGQWFIDARLLESMTLPPGQKPAAVKDRATGALNAQTETIKDVDLF